VPSLILRTRRTGTYQVWLSVFNMALDSSSPSTCALHDTLADAHVLEAIINADDKRVLLGAAAGNTLGRINIAVILTRTRRRNRHVEIVVLNFVIGDLPHRFDGLPIAGIERILGAADGREAIHRAERHV